MVHILKMHKQMFENEIKNVSLARKQIQPLALKYFHTSKHK